MLEKDLKNKIFGSISIAIVIAYLFGSWLGFYEFGFTYNDIYKLFTSTEYIFRLETTWKYMLLSLIFFLGISFTLGALLKKISKDAENLVSKTMLPVGILYIAIIYIGSGFYIYQLFQYIWLLMNS